MKLYLMKFLQLRKGAKKAIIKSKENNKQKLSVVFLIRADRVKFKPLIVFKGAHKGKTPKEVKSLSNEEIAYCAQ